MDLRDSFSFVSLLSEKKLFYIEYSYWQKNTFANAMYNRHNMKNWYINRRMLLYNISIFSGLNLCKNPYMFILEY